MDNWIPPISGIEAVKILKNDPILKKIPVIFFSATYDIETSAAGAGADTHLKKPFDISEVLNLVRSQMQNK